MNNTNNSEYKKYVSTNYNILFNKKNNYVKLSFNKKLNRYFTFTINQFMDINFHPFKFQENEDDEYLYETFYKTIESNLYLVLKDKPEFYTLDYFQQEYNDLITDFIDINEEDFIE